MAAMPYLLLLMDSMPSQYDGGNPDYFLILQLDSRFDRSILPLLSKNAIVFRKLAQDHAYFSANALIFYYTFFK